MGGGAMPEQGGGGKKKKKSLDATINVVPAIDLLSCLITFLLYAAVWTQISRLQVQQLGTGAPELATLEQQQKSLAVTLAVGERGMALLVGDSSYDIPNLGRSPEGVDAKASALNLPSSTVVDSHHNLIISDQANFCLRSVDPLTNIINSFCGQCTHPGYDGDGVPCSAAMLRSSQGQSAAPAGRSASTKRSWTGPSRSASTARRSPTRRRRSRSARSRNRTLPQRSGAGQSACVPVEGECVWAPGDPIPKTSTAMESTLPG